MRRRPRRSSRGAAQVSRSPRQAQLRRLLRGCEVVALDERGAHAAGRLLAASGTADVVGATVVATALTRHAVVLSSGRGDIARLAAAAGAHLVVIDV